MTAFHDPALELRLGRESALFYGEGADLAEDRPAHVRAASGLAWLGSRIAVIQDDANFIALVDPSSDEVFCITLPRGAGGKRLFGEARGNKAHKLDLESCVVVELGGEPTLMALGSGSTPERERVVLLTEGKGARLVHCSRLYAALRAARDFSGSELNVEGALVDGDTLRLFQRGNGAREPVNASIDVALRPFLVALEDGRDVEPVLGDVTQYALGTIDGVALAFTDVARGPDGRVLYLATAEASPDTFHDGAVTGTVLGVIEGDTARYGYLTDANGQHVARKAEGLLPFRPFREDPRRVYVAFDPDDTEKPAILAEGTLLGPWW